MAIQIERKKVDKEKQESFTPFESSISSSNFSSNEIENIAESKELPKKKILNKFHLPILNINKSDYWPSMPLKDRQHFTDEIAAKSCLGNCCGYEGLSAGCCQLDLEDLEHVLGYVEESDIERLLKHLKKSTPGIKREDVVIDMEEGILLGKQFFNDHPVFKDKDSYPMLRLQLFGSRFVCKFLSLETFKCTVYNHRPDMCREYHCEWLKSSFLLRTKDRPNTWQKLR